MSDSHSTGTMFPSLSDEGRTDRSQTVQISDDAVGFDGSQNASNSQFVRYRILCSHAKGGLGEVFRAEDLEIGREIALKEIQSARADDPNCRQRFLLEAEITGRLEHPGIVPVYGLGAYPDGRPYYAMRFIEGESFKEAIERFHQGPVAGQPAKRDFSSVEFRNLLRRFIDVCNAIAYAHSRGVLHRDLKPANVMLGKFGETLVVDWGLAKVLSDSAVSNARMRRFANAGGDSADSADDPTQDGALIGTPAYMSPEQASGEIDQLDARSDIYGLGATFYALLTGKAPVAGASALELVQKAQIGDIAAPRTVAPQVPAALDAICRKALARARENRYSSALELARDIDQWIADRPVSAYREPPLARLRRWSRQHRELVTSLAAVIVVSAVGLAGFALMLGKKNVDLQRTNEDLRTAREAAYAEKVEAQAERSRAERVLQFMVDSFRKPDPTQDGRTLTVASLLDRAVRRVDAEFAMDPHAAWRLLDAIGRTYGGLGEAEKGVPLFERSLAIAEKAYPVDHPERLVAEQNLATWLNMAHQGKRSLEIFERLAPRIEKVHGKNSKEAIAVRANMASAVEAAGQPLRAVEMLRQSMKDADAKYGVDHPETIWIERQYANALSAAGSHGVAYPHMQKVHRRLRESIGPDHPRTIDAALELASLQHSLGKLDEAKVILADSVERSRRVLGPEHGRTLSALNLLALIYDAQGNKDEAMTLYVESLAVLEKKHGSDAIDVARRRSNLAGMFLERKQYAKAIDLYAKSLSVVKSQLGDDNPDTLAITNNFAFALDVSGDKARAIPLYQDAHRAMVKALGADHPQTLTTLNNLAFNYKSLERLDEAIKLYEQALALYRGRHGNAYPDTLRAINNLAQAHYAAKNFAKAAQLHREFIAGVYPRVKSLPNSLVTRLPTALDRVVAECERSGDSKGAAEFRKMRAALPPPKPAKTGQEKKKT